jgi:acyl-CoA thioesterase
VVGSIVLLDTDEGFHVDNVAVRPPARVTGFGRMLLQLAESAMEHPFADLIGLRFEAQRAGYSRCMLEIDERHRNPNGVAHGAVLYALADTGMGAALFATLNPGERCATIQITMNYFKPVAAGSVTCTTELVSRGRSVAHLESRLFAADILVATANGNYAIFTPSAKSG